MKMLSIILPIYNVEQYLAQCLNSIYTQNVDEELFEVIAVIDGSPDESLKIAENYAQLHKNIIVINKDNGGVSSARNKGIELAKGEYIMFVDPDDTLMSDSLWQVMKKIKIHQADMFIFRSFNDGTKKERFSWKDCFDENRCFSGEEVFKKWGIRGAVWGAAYNRQFWLKNSLSFPLNIKNSEDYILFAQCQMKAQRIMFCDVMLYSVFFRNDSASHDITPQRIVHWFEALKLTKDIKFKCTQEIELAIIDSVHYSILSSIINNSVKVLDWQAISFLEEHRIKDFLPVSKASIKYSSMSNKLMKYILNYSFPLFFIITYLRNKLP